MSTTKIKDIMTGHPTMIGPQDKIDEAARRMKSVDCGCLPVGSDSDVVGIVTDRDITLRVIAEGRDPKTTLVQDVMTKGAYTIDQDSDVEDAAAEMKARKVARLVVTNKKKVTGIVTLAEILRDAAAGIHGPKVLRELAKARPGHHAAH